MYNVVTVINSHNWQVLTLSKLYSFHFKSAGFGSSKECQDRKKKTDGEKNPGRLIFVLLGLVKSQGYYEVLRNHV